MRVFVTRHLSPFPRREGGWRGPGQVGLALAVAVLLASLAGCAGGAPAGRAPAGQTPAEWMEDFNLANRKLSDTGTSKYFVLSPGFQTVLASRHTKLTITVLDETRDFNGITTRVVEEREEKNGEVIEVARNFFAIDQATGDVFYFGEEVDMYARGVLVSHSGAWLAYVNGNKPGLIMAGNPVVGMKYYQELARGVAMDRAEVITMSETCRTPAGEFANCLKTRESSSLEPVTEYKAYAPGIGLIEDQALQLISYGYVKRS